MPHAGGPGVRRPDRWRGPLAGRCPDHEGSTAGPRGETGERALARQPAPLGRQQPQHVRDQLRVVGLRPEHRKRRPGVPEGHEQDGDLRRRPLVRRQRERPDPHGGRGVLAGVRPGRDPARRPVDRPRAGLGRREQAGLPRLQDGALDRGPAGLDPPGALGPGQRSDGDRPARAPFVERVHDRRRALRGAVEELPASRPPQPR